jgi:hypothetical protein
LLVLDETEGRQHILPESSEVIRHAPQILLQQIHSLVTQSKLFDKVFDILQCSGGVLGFSIGSCIPMVSIPSLSIVPLSVAHDALLQRREGTRGEGP